MLVYHLSSGSGVDRIRRADRRDPQPSRCEILIRMRAASLNFRDLLVVRGIYGSATPADIVPLSDGAGEVIAIGEDVTRFKVGDMACPTFYRGFVGGRLTPNDVKSALGGHVDGVLAEYVTCNEQFAVRPPSYMSYEEAACLPCAAVTAWAALYGPCPLAAGETVLTLGTGGVSTLAVQFARAAGARVISTSSSDEKLRTARSLGANDTINYVTHPDWEREVLRLTRGIGVDHVIEVGGGGTLSKSIASTRLGGQIHMIGVLTSGTIDPRALLQLKTVRGILVGSRSHFEAMNQMLDVHRIAPLIDKVFPFEDAVEAYRYLESAQHAGKVVIRFPD